jgi:hypothetical protein
VTASGPIWSSLKQKLFPKETSAMDESQRQKLAELFAQEYVAVNRDTGRRMVDRDIAGVR